MIISKFLKFLDLASQTLKERKTHQLLLQPTSCGEGHEKRTVTSIIIEFVFI